MSRGARHRRFLLLGAAMAGLALAGSALAFQGTPKEKLVKLKKRSVKEGAFRPGFGVSETLPEEAWVARLGRKEVWFLDLDGDGSIGAGKDGFAMKGIPFYVRLPKTLLLQQGQFHIRVDTGAGKLGLTHDPLDINPQVIQKAAVLTDVRLNAGLEPVTLDSEASRRCGLHIEYLKQNGMADGSGGLSAHGEDPSKPGYTREGAAAGAGSNIGFGVANYGVAVLEWYSMAWHGAPMVDPTLRKVGVGLKYGVAMFYKYAHEGYQEEPYLHPPDGAINVLRNFSVRGELPDPVPGVPGKKLGRGCGFPIHIRPAGKVSDRKLVKAKLFDAKGKSLAGLFSCPQKPATSEWPSNASCAFFVPFVPLKGGTRHRAEFHFEGLEKPIVWEFTTGR